VQGRLLCRDLANRSSTIDITGIDHIYLSVRDFARSERFYDGVMEALGFKKSDEWIAGEPHAHYLRPTVQITLRPARSQAPFDSYAAGLHHLCLQAATQADIDEAHRKLTALGVSATAPRLYPEYNPEYYATFFEDPDGLRLEIVGRTTTRRTLAERWNQFTRFLNPWSN
jgi:glyoxylase I family protein